MAAQKADGVVFVGATGRYPGRYGMAEHSIAVVIDGVAYSGHFSDTQGGAGTAANGTPLNGSWGRAFLFASSAKVLQCRLDAGFPDVNGLCHDADGRTFQLMPASGHD